jgi:hypothetical protein
VTQLVTHPKVTHLSISHEFLSRKGHTPTNQPTNQPREKVNQRESSAKHSKQVLTGEERGNPPKKHFFFSLVPPSSKPNRTPYPISLFVYQEILLIVCIFLIFLFSKQRET